MEETLRVLMVDDEQSFLDQAEIFLEKQNENFEVVTAPSAKKALESLEDEDFDVIVSDYLMPEMDGLEFLKKIRGEKELTIPFIIFTGRGREEVAMKALNSGADRYLQKRGEPKSQFDVLSQAIDQEYTHWKSKKELEKSEEEKSLILNSLDELVMLQDLEGKIKWVNEVGVEYADADDEEEIAGEYCYEVWHGRETRCEGCPIEKVIEEKETFKGDVTTPDGKIWRVSEIPILDSEDDLESILEIAMDVTERRETERSFELLIESLVEKTGKEFFDSVVKEVIKFFDAHIALVGKLNDEKEVVDTISMIKDGELINEFKYRLKGAPCGDVAEEGPCLFSENVVKKFPKDSDLEDLGAEGYAGVPIKNSKGETIGLIAVISREKLYPPERWEEALKIISAKAFSEIERKETEEELKGREEKYRTLFESAEDAILIMDEETFIDCNEKTLEIFECTREDILGEPPYKFSPEEQPDGRKSKDKALEKIEAAFEGDPQSFEWLHNTKDGKPFYAHVKLSRYEVDNKELLMSIVRDISGQKQTEEELRKSKSRYETLFEENPEAVVEVDEDHKIKKVNKKFEDLFGYEEEEIVDKRLNDLIVPEDKIQEAEELDERSKEGYFEHETVRKTKDEKEIPVAITGRPIKLDGKKRFLGVYRNIEERKKVEKKLEKRNEKIKKLHDMATRFENCEREKEICELVIEASERILNFHVCGIDLVEEGEFVPVALSSEIDGGFIRRKVEDAGISKRVYQKKESLLVKDSREVSFSKPVVSDYRSSITIPMGDFGIFQALSTELSAFDEEDLELAEILVKHATEAINSLRSEEKLKERMNKVEELHKVSARLETCQTEEEIYSQAMKAAEKILEFDMCGFDAVEGNKFVPKASSSEIPEDGHIDMPLDDAGMATKTYMNKKSYLVDDLRKETESKPVKTDYRAMISLPIGEHGVFQAVSTETNHFDEEDLKMAELLMDHVFEALNRVEMEEKEEFLHSLLRHDFRNKSQLVKGYLDLVEEFDLSDEAEDYIQKAKKNTYEGMEIINKVRRLRELEREEEVLEFNLDNTLDKVLSEYSAQLEEKDIEIDVQKDKLKVKAGSLLKILFSNLIENSIHHASCDKIRIRTEVEDEKCVVIVEDDGTGIDDEDKEKLFDKGFKKGEKSGSGLGLYLVKEIAKNYNGEIEVKDSELGGSRFDVRLKMA